MTSTDTLILPSVVPTSVFQGSSNNDIAAQLNTKSDLKSVVPRHIRLSSDSDCPAISNDHLEKLPPIPTSVANVGQEAPDHPLKTLLNGGVIATRDAAAQASDGLMKYNDFASVLFLQQDEDMVNAVLETGKHQPVVPASSALMKHLPHLRFSKASSKSAELISNGIIPYADYVEEEQSNVYRVPDTTNKEMVAPHAILKPSKNAEARKKVPPIDNPCSQYVKSDHMRFSHKEYALFDDPSCDNNTIRCNGIATEKRRRNPVTIEFAERQALYDNDDEEPTSEEVLSTLIRALSSYSIENLSRRKLLQGKYSKSVAADMFAAENEAIRREEKEENDEQAKEADIAISTNEIAKKNQERTISKLKEEPVKEIEPVSKEVTGRNSISPEHPIRYKRLSQDLLYDARSNQFYKSATNWSYPVEPTQWLGGNDETDGRAAITENKGALSDTKVSPGLLSSTILMSGETIDIATASVAAAKAAKADLCKRRVRGHKRWFDYPQLVDESHGDENIIMAALQSNPQTDTVCPPVERVTTPPGLRRSSRKNESTLPASRFHASRFSNIDYGEVAIKRLGLFQIASMQTSTKNNMGKVKRKRVEAEQLAIATEYIITMRSSSKIERLNSIALGGVNIQTLCGAISRSVLREIMAELTTAIHDPEPLIRFTAANTLCALGVTSSKGDHIDVFREALTSGTDKYAWPACCCLAFCGNCDTEVISMLISALDMSTRVDAARRFLEMLVSDIRGESQGDNADVILCHLHEALRSASWKKRREAARLIGDFGCGESKITVSTNIVDSLLTAMWNDWKFEVRQAAVGAIDRLGQGERGCDSIADRLASSNHRDRIGALLMLKALEKIPRRFQLAVTAALGDSYAKVRKEAANVVSVNGKASKMILQELLPLLQDESADVRQAAVKALGSVSERDDVIEKELLWLIEFDVDAHVVAEGISTIKKLGITNNESIISAIRERYERHDNEWLGAHCVETLRSMNFDVSSLREKASIENGVRTLVRLLGTKEAIVERFFKEPDPVSNIFDEKDKTNNRSESRGRSGNKSRDDNEGSHNKRSNSTLSTIDSPQQAKMALAIANATAQLNLF